MFMLKESGAIMHRLSVCSDLSLTTGRHDSQVTV